MNHSDGNPWMDRFQVFGHVALLARDISVALFRWRPRWRDLLDQVYFVGIQSQSVVLITGAFTGMVLAAQTYFQFHKVHMDTATLAVVGISMSSELGPVLTGLMVAGRVGSAMAAELGTMRVTEQIDAMRTLSAHPVDCLVVPRFLATLVALPVLCVEAVSIAIGASFLLAMTYLDIPLAYAWHNMVRYTGTEDVLTGLIKSFIFGGLIALVSCSKGLTCRGGAQGVGRATTEAVVLASISILVSNFFLTLALNRILQPQ